MAMTTIPEPDANNVWRTETPGNAGWIRSARPDADDKFFMVSADGHVQEPRTFLSDRLPEEYHSRLPGIVLDAKGDQHQTTEGFRQAKLNWVQPFEGHEKLRNESGPDPRGPDPRPGARRLRCRDPVPQQGPHDLGHKGCPVQSPDVQGVQRLGLGDIRRRQRSSHADGLRRPGRARRDPGRDQTVCRSGFQGPVPAVQAGVRPAERRRPQLQPLRVRAALGLHHRRRPAHHLPRLDGPRPPNRPKQRRGHHQLHHPLAGPDHGAAGQHLRLRRGRTAPDTPVRGHRGRYRLGPVDAGGHGRGLSASITCGCGPSWTELPSDYFRRQGFSSFQEDKPGLDLAREHDLVDNFLWANDFPHHEGSWPYSAQAIERTMAGLTDGERAKILGLNAARIFRVDVPERFRNHADAAVVAQSLTGHN